MRSALVSALLPFLQNIISGMKQFEDETAQLSALTELCELLSISTEESLTTFPVEQVVPLLVSDTPLCITDTSLTNGSLNHSRAWFLLKWPSCRKLQRRNGVMCHVAVPCIAA